MEVLTRAASRAVLVWGCSGGSGGEELGYGDTFGTLGKEQRQEGQPGESGREGGGDLLSPCYLMVYVDVEGL